ncbi:MAG TPA: response regulator transcription factor [Candidatus Methylomirabilis sp.]|nr:response regulator transcription factor [Candidatus Methylomirabilis sp.]
MIVDDHPMVREGLRSMLAGEEIEIVGEAASGRDAVQLAAEHRPEVMLLDLELPDIDGLAVLREVS